MQRTTTLLTPPARRKLTLSKETLRRLTPAQLRLAGGGAAAVGWSASCTTHTVTITTRPTTKDPTQ